MNDKVITIAQNFRSGRWSNNFLPVRPMRSSNDNVGDVVVGGIPSNFLHGRNARRIYRLSTKLFCIPHALRDSVPGSVGRHMPAPCLDMDRGPGCTQPRRRTPRIAHKSRSILAIIDAYEHAFASSPWTRDGIGPHMGNELLVNALGGAPQGQLPQGCQVPG